MNTVRVHCRNSSGFTLVEVLVASAVLAVILVIMVSMVSQTTNIWRSSNARIEAFQSARLAFETLTRSLSQATLNTYWDYDNPNAPGRYERKSELHFLVANTGKDGMPGTEGTGQAVFFQAPANKTGNAGAYDGLVGLLNAGGFFVQYGSDSDWLPTHVGSAQSRDRFRLMQWMQNTEDLEVYAYTPTATVDADAWIDVSNSDLYPLADNVIALVIWPKEEGNPASPILNSYGYDSREDARDSAVNQLPPVLQVAMVAIDENSALRLGNTLKSEIDTCLSGLFQDPPGNVVSGDQNQFTEDLKTLEERLAGKSINFRTFVSAIPMREAKWSP